MGKATYIDDVRGDDPLYMAILRSTHPHARIKEIDFSRALRLRGVKAVYTGKDVMRLGKPLLHEPIVPGARVPPRYPLAVEKVLYVGEPVVAVVASDKYVAADALELIDIEYEPMRPIMDPLSALSAPPLHSGLDSNVGLRWSHSSGDVEAAFRDPKRVVSRRLSMSRVSPSAIEPIGSVARYDPGSDEVTLWASTQRPHYLKTVVANCLEVPENRVRVIAPDVGGGFGGKVPVYPEYLLSAIIAKDLRSTVKWIATRSEELQSAVHARGVVADVEMALSEDARILGLRARILMDIGAYMNALTPLLPVIIARMLPGCYSIENYSVEVLEVFTNKLVLDIYRGAGRPEATYIIEKMIDFAARQLGIDSAEMRLRNFIPRDRFPYETSTGLIYDSGDYAKALKRAMELIGYEELRREQRRLREEGRYIGIGISTYVEVCGGLAGGWESATIRVDPTGKVTVLTGASPQGQGTATTLAQITAEELGIDIDDVVVIYGDTLLVQYGWGTVASRSTTIGGGAVKKACEVLKERAKEIAATVLEVNPQDLIFEGGRVFVRGNPESSLSLRDVARVAYGRSPIKGSEPGLLASSYHQEGPTFPFGAHICVAEVDLESGEVKILRYVCVDDSGKIINPLLAEGQVHGGVAQGLAQALYEEIIYGDGCQLLTSTWADYLLPTAREVIDIISEFTETPAPSLLGSKGIGESGTIGSIAAFSNAVDDALSPLGLRADSLPLKPYYLWSLINERSSS